MHNTSKMANNITVDECAQACCVHERSHDHAHENVEIEEVDGDDYQPVSNIANVNSKQVNSNQVNSNQVNGDQVNGDQGINAFDFDQENLPNQIGDINQMLQMLRQMGMTDKQIRKHLNSSDKNKEKTEEPIKTYTKEELRQKLKDKMNKLKNARKANTK